MKDLNERPDTLILGGGLAGLSAGYALTRAGRSTAVIESGRAAGGLARTIERRGFRFDLGGHRFLTHDKSLEAFVAGLVGNSLLEPARRSKIFLRDRYFDYPLKPANALFGLGIPTTVRILSDYCRERLAAGREPASSLEDWVISRFGRAMFELYFRDYSEKVWGLPCSKISAEWVAQRIAGLSLSAAIRNAFSKRSGKEIPTLADRFLYPTSGIGEIGDRLSSGIEAANSVWTDTRVLRLDHGSGLIHNAMVRTGGTVRDIDAAAFISTIPLTSLVRMLHPAPPSAVREAAQGLRFRDLVVAVLMIDREQVTDLSWMYLPEKKISLGRIHEPKNWSPLMAPPGKTHLVAEYFCSEGDSVWSCPDQELAGRTAGDLSGLGLFRQDEVIDSVVVRVPRAYPILDTGYRHRHRAIMEYLAGFENLRTAGRSGTFQYLNMDHALASGMSAAEAVLKMPEYTGSGKRRASAAETLRS